MTEIQIGTRTIPAKEIMPLLASYQMIPQLLRESILDQAIESIRCTPEEIAEACQQFYRYWSLTDATRQQVWRSHYNLSQEQLEHLANRKLRVEKFKQATWGHKLEAYFLKRKRHLDQVIYSLLRTKDREIAIELYFRLREGEQSFAECREYAQDPEAQTGGIIGPVKLGRVQPKLAALIYASQVGVVQPPVSIGSWHLLVRVEQIIPSQLEQAMRQRLLQENFESWLQEQLQQLPRDQWLGVTPSHSGLTDDLVAA